MSHISALFGENLPWPPEEDRIRIKRQKTYRAAFDKAEPTLLFRGEQWKSKPVETWEGSFVKVVANAYSNLLFGEGIGLGVSSNAPEDASPALDRIKRESNLGCSLFCAATQQSVEGRAYLKVRRGPKNSMDPKTRVIIEPLEPSSVFRLEDPGNKMFPVGFAIVTEITTGKPGKRDSLSYLLVEAHFPGRIEYQAWLVSREAKFVRVGSAERKIIRQVTMAEVFEGGLVPAGIPQGTGNEMGGSVETGIDQLLVAEVDNLPSSGWSHPDLLGSEGTTRMIDDRISRDTEILNKHANPKMRVPTGLLDEKGQVMRQTFDGMLFEVDPSSGLLLPDYITWDAKMKDSFEYLDRMIDMALLNTGLAKQIIGFEGKTGFADSGTALRLRMIPTLATVNRKRLHFHPAIDQIMRSALALADGIEGFGQTALRETDQIIIAWRDGLPEDPLESARIAQARSANGRTASVESLVRESHPDWSEEEVAIEVEKIRDDEQKSSPTAALFGPRE